MMALGHQLRADDQFEAALRDVVEFRAQPLDAGADGGEAVGGVTVRTFRRRRHREAAMMADQPFAEAVIDQPGIAIRALQAEAAGTAERERRIAAAGPRAASRWLRPSADARRRSARANAHAGSVRAGR